MAPTAKEIEAMVNEFQRQLEGTRVAYEQYFLGMERLEPQGHLRDLERMLRRLDQTYISNTGIRFRFRSIQQKMNVYRNYWNRTLRAIEAGTYHRDVARMRRKMVNKGIDMPALKDLKSTADIERAVRDAGENPVRDGRGEASPSARKKQTPQPNPNLPSEKSMESLYKRFVRARKLTGEDTANLTYDKMVKTLEKQLPRLKQLHGDRDVDFQVVVRSGRAILKAKAK
jgi:hypothetical protein